MYDWVMSNRVVSRAIMGCSGPFMSGVFFNEYNFLFFITFTFVEAHGWRRAFCRDLYASYIVESLRH